MCYTIDMIIAIDIGGTKTLVSILNNDMEIIQSIKFATPKNYDEFGQALTGVAKQLPLNDIRAGVIGARGVIDRKNGSLRLDTILGWHNVPLVRDCTKIFGCKFSIENDSKLAGLSEARTISDSTVRTIIYITISTGIGSTFVVNNQLEQATINSEIGKWLVEKDGNWHIWEDIASGQWIKATYGKLASEIDDETTWREIVDHLAPGFINIMAAYAPDLIIVGGGVGEHFDKFGALLSQEIAIRAHPMVKQCPLQKAKYPELAVTYGCYYHALDQLAA